MGAPLLPLLLHIHDIIYDMNPYRIVLDTNVMVAGLRSRRGASFQILSLIPDERFAMLVSIPLFAEYEAVLRRPEQRQVHGLSDADLDVLLAVWARYAKPVELRYLWRPQLRDPADEMVLETAINGQADALITLNTRDFQPAIERFALSLWSPGELFRRITS